MKDGADLEAASLLLCPEAMAGTDWGDMWTRPLSSGKALEWTTLFAVLAAAKEAGWQVQLPPLEVGRDILPLRNAIPLQHGSQPGHGGARDLASRMLGAFLPKAVISKDDVFVSLFREGCAYHQGASDKPPGLRPDILVLPGRPLEPFPRLSEDRQSVEYAFRAGSTEVAGAVRVVDSPAVRLIWRSPAHAVELPVPVLVECSVRKAPAHLAAQVREYQNMYRTSAVTPAAYFVSGAPVPEETAACAYREVPVSGPVDRLLNEFLILGHEIVDLVPGLEGSEDRGK